MARKRKPTQPIRERSMHEEEEEEEDIPMEEQVRLIEQSGVLQLQELEGTEPGPPDEQAQSTEKPGLGDEIFDAIILLIPFSCLYIGMDVMIKQQYAQHPSFMEEVGQLANAFPILGLLIFYTNRYKHSTVVQIGLAIASAASGSRLTYLVNKESWGVVIQQCPPLGVLWVYTVVQLHLAYACAALLVVFGYVRYNALKIVF